MPVKLEKLQLNPTNPRTIKDEQFKKLVSSLRAFPAMLSKRPLVIDNFVVLGGNMRLEAIKEIMTYSTKEDHEAWAPIREAGKLPDSWLIKADDFTEEEKKEFIIKDNISFGTWNIEALTTEEWNPDKLKEWGVDLPDWAKKPVDEDREQDFSSFDKSANSYLNGTVRQIVLYYDVDQHKNVLERLAAVIKKYGLEEDNSVAVIKLLEFHESSHKKD